MLNRTALAAAAALALALPPAAGAMDYAGMTADLSAPIVNTEASLVPEDSNHAQDYYAYVGGAPRLLTSGTGADDVQQLWRASGDGSIAYFRTSDALVPEDADTTNDLYVRRPSGVSIIAPQAATAVDVVDLSSDGGRAFLRTKAPLLAADADETSDVYRYESATGELTLLTTGTTLDVSFHAGDDATGAAIFSTVEALAMGDGDQVRDVYSGDGASQPALLTAGDGPQPAHFMAYSADGQVAYWTDEQLTASDDDSAPDLYTGADGNAATLRTPSPNPVADAEPVGLLAVAQADMHRVLFSTSEPLVPGDMDTHEDYYAHDEGKLTLLTPGTGVDLVFEDASTDAEVMLFSTRDPVLASDTDDRMDMYRSGDAGPQHVSKTNGPFDEFDGALSFNGVLTAFQTAEPISGSDGDGVTDVYRLDKGGLHLMSRRDAGASGGGTEHHAEVRDFLATSELIMETPERLLGADRNGVSDVYAIGFSGLAMVTRDDSAPDTMAAAPAQTLPGEAFPVTAGSTEPGTFECRLDAGDWVACASGWSPGGLAAGEHTIEVRATDANGNVDATPAQALVVAATAEEQQTETGKPPVTTQTAQTPENPFPPGAGDAVAPALTTAKVRVRRRVPTLTYSLSEAATVRVAVQRRAGRRWKTLRTRSLTGAAGANRAVLAKLPRRGAFRVTLVATDAAGNASSRLVLRPTRR